MATIAVIQDKPHLGFGETTSKEPLVNKVWDVKRCIIVYAVALVAMVALGALLGSILSLPVALFKWSAQVIGIAAKYGCIVGFLGSLALMVYGYTKLYRPVPLFEHVWNEQHGTPPVRLGTPVSNQMVYMCKDGADSLEWKIDLMRNAKHSIEWCINFGGRAPFLRSMDAVEEAMKKNPNLRVHLMVSKEVLWGEDIQRIEKLQAAYPNFNCLIINMKLNLGHELTTTDCHVKALIVDELDVVVGGSGADTSLSQAGVGTPVLTPKISIRERIWNWGWMEASRDLDVVCRGRETARALRWEFFKLWKIWKYQMSRSEKLEENRYFPVAEKTEACPLWEKALKEKRIIENVVVTSLVSEPGKKNAITDKMIQMIQTAKKTIRISSMVFNLKNNELKDALLKAILDGRKVTVITNESHSHCAGAVNLWGHVHEPEGYNLLTGGKGDLQQDPQTDVRMLLFGNKETPRTMYHAKTLVVDEGEMGGAVMVGSNNLGPNSYYRHFENCLVFQNAENAREDNVTKPFAARLQEDEKYCREYTLKEAREKQGSWLGNLQAHTFLNSCA